MTDTILGVWTIALRCSWKISPLHFGEIVVVSKSLTCLLNYNLRVPHINIIALISPLLQIQLQIQQIPPAMASKFVENLEEVPITHPHLNVSLDDILAEEGRKRSSSQSSSSSHSNGRSGSETAQSPTSPTHPEGHLGSITRRAFALGSKKIRRTS